ncbi:MAG: hypothetical protein E6J70_17880 [Deltaproteobacteria bacterium]|nr:MAG: hypothetical protein E6J70_17880 [Deltaproteobacteria bacterium]
MTASVLIHDRGNCEGPVTVPRRSFHMTSHRQGGIMPPVRLAAIDVGSNSLHMLVADVSPDGRIQVVDRLKEMVRLGRRAFTSGKLDREAAELALRTLKTFERLARARHVERLGAVATSAVREARNGAAFVRLPATPSVSTAAPTCWSTWGAEASSSCSSATGGHSGCGACRSAWRG